MMGVSNINFPVDMQIISALQWIWKSGQQISRFLQHIYIPWGLLTIAVTSLCNMALNSMLWCLVNCESYRRMLLSLNFGSRSAISWTAWQNIIKILSHDNSWSGRNLNRYRNKNLYCYNEVARFEFTELKWNTFVRKFYPTTNDNFSLS